MSCPRNSEPLPTGRVHPSGPQSGGGSRQTEAAKTAASNSQGKSANSLDFERKPKELALNSGTPETIRTSDPSLRSGFNMLLISNSKTRETLDTAEFHRCHTACYVRLFSANFHRFLWSQLASY